MEELKETLDILENNCLTLQNRIKELEDMVRDVLNIAELKGTPPALPSKPEYIEPRRGSPIHLVHCQAGSDRSITDETEQPRPVMDDRSYKVDLTINKQKRPKQKKDSWCSCICSDNDIEIENKLSIV
jgi:hypothetical protein